MRKRRSRPAPEELWNAYRALDGAKVRGSPQRILTNLVPLVRYALHQREELAPFPEEALPRFERWIAEQETRGRPFTEEERWWLEKVFEHVAANMEITLDDLDYAPFSQRGGLAGAHRVFGERLREILDEMTEVVAA